jgi:hypothetical protein
MKEIKWGDGIIHTCSGKECFTHDRAWCTAFSSLHCQYRNKSNIHQITFIKKEEK